MELFERERIIENKIILLYCIDSFGTLVSKTLLSSFIINNEIMDYFSFCQFMSELTEDRFLEEVLVESESYYMVTKQGRESIKAFINFIPTKRMDLIKPKIDIQNEKIEREKEISANFKQKGPHNYYTSLQVTENDIQLIKLDLSVVTQEQAKKICRTWQKNAPQIYGKILKYLIEESEVSIKDLSKKNFKD